MSLRARSRVIAASLFFVGAIALFGCSGSPSGSGLGFLTPKPVDEAPAADTPLHLVDTFQWCYEHRDEARYRGLFTADFIFEFSASDSSGSTYHDSPWRREDELIFAHNLFVAGSGSEAPASSIALMFSGTQVGADLRPGKTSPVHQSIDARYTLTIQKTDGTGLQCVGEVRFYVVRGDSADVPPDLGLAPDAGRWFVERLVDETLGGAVQSASLANPVHAMPTRATSLGRIRSLYR